MANYQTRKRKACEADNYFCLKENYEKALKFIDTLQAEINLCHDSIAQLQANFQSSDKYRADLIASLSESLVKSMLKEKSKGKASIERLSKYSHSDFLSDHDGNGSFIHFIQEVLDKAQESCLTNNFNIGIVQARRPKACASVLSACLYCLDPVYASVSAYLTSFMILAKCWSSECADYANFALCGGRSSATIFKDLGGLDEKARRFQLNLCRSSTVVAAMDNNSRQYRFKTSRAGTGQRLRADVWTNRELHVMIPRPRLSSGMPVESIQFDISLAPYSKSWKSVKDFPLHICDFDDNRVLDNDVLGDMVYIRQEIIRSLIFVITEYAHQDIFHCHSTNLLVDTSVAAAERNSTKICTNCAYDKNAKNLSNCKLCDRKLKTMAEIRRNNETDIGDYLFKPRSMRHKRMKVVNVEDVDSHDENNAFSAAAGDCYRQILLPECVNPNKKANIEHLMRLFVSELNVVMLNREEAVNELQLNVERMRQWFILVADEGAMCLDKIDDPSGEFRHIVQIIGVFHECKMFLEIVLDMLFSIGGAFLAALHTYSSPAGREALRSAFDLHKANDFLRNVAKPALNLALVHAYWMSRVGTDGDGTRVGAIDAEAVYAWALQSSECDYRYRNIAFFTLNILPAYELIKKGIRNGDMSAYNAGRRFLLPFCFALGRTKYAPLIARDMIQYYFRAPTPVKQLLREVFELYDEGLDGKLEELNKTQKSFVYADTREAVQCSAILTAMVPNMLRDVMYRMSSSGRVPRASSTSRAPTDLDDDIKNCFTFLKVNNIFQKSTTVTKPLAFDNETEAQSDMSLLELYEFGQEELSSWLLDYKTSDSFTFPKVGGGRKFQKGKDTVAEYFNTLSASGDGEGEEEDSPAARE
jgi:hypothetical protein